jgi:hypothetical protein
MPASCSPAVKFNRISTQSPPQRPRQGILLFGYCDQVQMIRHQAKCRNCDPASVARVQQQRQKPLVIVRRPKDALAVVSALRYMVSDSCKNIPGTPRHKTKVPQRPKPLKKVTVTFLALQQLFEFAEGFA